MFKTIHVAVPESLHSFLKETAEGEPYHMAVGPFCRMVLAMYKSEHDTGMVVGSAAPKSKPTHKTPKPSKQKTAATNSAPDECTHEELEAWCEQSESGKLESFPQPHPAVLSPATVDYEEEDLDALLEELKQ